MPETINLQGKPLQLEGTEIQVGQKAPDFTARKSLAEDVTLKDFAGKTVVLSVVPSLDTPVCDVMGRRFNKEAAKLGSNVVVLLISADLPTAQSRWCGASDVASLVMLSDYKDHDFGFKYGVRIKDFGILCRAVFVIDPDGTVIYAEYVPEIGQEPDYEAALAAVSGETPLTTSGA